MADLPPTIEVGPYTYELLCDVESSLALREDHDDNANADCSPGDARIRIHHETNLTVRRGLVVHEVLHACWDVAGLDGDPALDAVNEQAVTGLTAIVLDVLRRNPDLVAYLTA